MRGAGGPELVSLLLQTGRSQAAAGYLDRALASCESARRLAESIGDVAAQAEALGNAGILWLGKGKPDTGLEVLRLCEGMCWQAGNRLGEVKAVANIGLAFKDKGDTDAAQAYLDKALHAVREIGARPEEARILGNLARVLIDRGALPEALDAMQRVQALMQELDDRPGEAAAVGNVGEVLVQMGRHEEALSCYGAAHVIHAELGDFEGDATDHLNIGETLATVDRHDEATAHLVQVLRAFVTIGSATSLRMCVDLHAECMGRLGQTRFSAACEQAGLNRRFRQTVVEVVSRRSIRRPRASDG